MIAAMDTDGRVWFTLTHSKTNSKVIAMFLHSLTKVLDQESPGWQEDTVFLWDNAPYHTSDEAKAIVKLMKLSTIYSGPYSFSAAPIELVFGGMKFGEINPRGVVTGKR